MGALNVLAEHGLTATAEGDELVITPADCLDDELRGFIRQHKSEILESLRGTVHGIPLTELREEAGPDWPELESDPELLETFALAVQTRRMREKGEVPPNYTAVTECAGCGPVPIWPNCPPRRLACPWCANRLSGRPMPATPAKPLERSNDAA